MAVATHLGIQESAARVALTRMVANGDLERDDGIYRLSPRLIERRRRQEDSLHPTCRPWHGHWQMAVVTVVAEDSTDRASLRQALHVARFGELREGVWMRPDNLDIRLPSGIRNRVSLFTARPQEASSTLADRLFAPRTWADAAESLLAADAEAESIGERFEVAAAIVRHVLDDPLLPPELLPDRWPGNAVRERYETFRSEFTEHVAKFFVAPSA